MAAEAERRLLLQHADERELTKIAAYEQAGGYGSTRTALGMDRQ